MITARYLCFRQNQISVIEHLENCTRLVELDLRDNTIGRLQGLDTLVNLEVFLTPFPLLVAAQLTLVQLRVL